MSDTALFQTRTEIQNATCLFHSNRHTEKNHTLQAFFHQGLQERFELVDTPSLLPRQSCNFLFSVGVVGDEDGVDKHRLCEVPSVGLPCSEGRMMDTAVEDGAVGMKCELVPAWSLHGRTISGEGAPGSGLFAGVTYLEKSDEEASGEAAGEKMGEG